MNVLPELKEQKDIFTFFYGYIKFLVFMVLPNLQFTSSSLADTSVRTTLVHTKPSMVEKRKRIERNAQSPISPFLH